MNGFSKRELKEILGGDYFNDFVDELVINNFEIDPIHLQDTNKQSNGFISISTARWNQANNKETKWIS
ncbi:MAG: hypothetical protein AB2401_06050, partial [Bacillus sp. (in: firmicutes)]